MKGGIEISNGGVDGYSVFPKGSTIGEINVNWKEGCRSTYMNFRGQGN